MKKKLMRIRGRVGRGRSFRVGLVEIVMIVDLLRVFGIAGETRLLCLVILLKRNNIHLLWVESTKSVLVAQLLTPPALKDSASS